MPVILLGLSVESSLLFPWVLPSNTIIIDFHPLMQAPRYTSAASTQLGSGGEDGDPGLEAEDCLSCSRL